MFSDIVVPKNNESEFIDAASKLGIKKLYFLYEFGSNQKEILEKFQPLRHKKITIEAGFIINQNNMNVAFQHSKMLVAKSSDNDRHFIESKKIKLIYGLEGSPRKDYLHQRASGLNHILCELAARNNVTIGIPYSALLNKKPAESSLVMGRMMQNIALCRKYRAKTIIASFSGNPFELRAPHDISSLFAMLGMSGKIINESLSYNL